MASAAPIIVTASFGDADFALLDGLRLAHFPPERNVVPAHLTLFHHLPPSVGDELDTRLKALTRGMTMPAAMILGAMSLGNGVALRVRSDDLARQRTELADAFTGLLTPQDKAGWRPHITIQNKVQPLVARELLAKLSAQFAEPQPLMIVGLASWRYLGGPWEAIRRYPFGRGR